MSEFDRLTSRQVIKHSDGTSHTETFCHGHKYGPAAFPEKYGTSNPQEYQDYCEMIDRLSQYEDIGSPEEFAILAKAKAEIILKNRIVGSYKNIQCEECGGKGFYEVRSPEGHFTEGCVKCGGSGKTQMKISLEEYDILKKKN